MNPLKLALLPVKSNYFSPYNPLGCEVLAAHIERTFKEDVEVEIHEYRFQDDEDLFRSLLQREPHIIGLSSFFDSEELTKQLIRQIRQLPSLAESLILVGNLNGIFRYQSFLQEDPRIICITGHGEIPLQQICEILQHQYSQHKIDSPTSEILNQSCLRSINNLAYIDPETGELVTTARIPTDPSKLGPTRFKTIKKIIAQGGSMTLRTSYGCTHRCTFCSVQVLNGTRNWYEIPVEYVVEDFRFIYEHGYRQTIGIVDDNFWNRSFWQMESLIKGLEQLKEEVGQRIPFWFSSRADSVINPKDSPEERIQRADLWKRLVEVGLDWVFIGFESASDSQLKRYAKGIKKEVNYEAYNFLTGVLGIQVGFGFIGIDPLMGDEWRETMKENLSFIKATRMYEYSPSFLIEMRAFEQTPYLKMLEDRGLKKERIPGTLEYGYEYLSPEVKQFVTDLKPFFSNQVMEDSNPYYKFKNTLKVIIRGNRQNPLSKELFDLSDHLAITEINYVESLLEADITDRNFVEELKENVTRELLSTLERIEHKLSTSQLPFQFSEGKRLQDDLEKAITHFEKCQPIYRIH